MCLSPRIVGLQGGVAEIRRQLQPNGRGRDAQPVCRQKTLPSCGETIDSVRAQADSIGLEYAKAVQSAGLMSMPLAKATTLPATASCRTPAQCRLGVQRLNIGIYTELPADRSEKTKRQRQDYEFKGYALADKRKTIRRHGIELQRSSHCRLPVWCFLYRRSLGAIILRVVWECRVISVFLFIFYSS